MSVLVKICGISDEAALDAALDAGADMVGFVFFEPSPRHVSLARAIALSERAGRRARRVALTVDADDDALDAIVAEVGPDILQLHGSETSARVAAIRARYGRPVMPALRIGAAADLRRADDLAQVADFLLFDAPTPAKAERPGGNGATFDWGVLREAPRRVPWLLAGGLDAGNVAAAITQTSAPGVDVSSGVESAPGVKDATKIATFVAAARNL